jgi:hypothetical protein
MPVGGTIRADFFVTRDVPVDALFITEGTLLTIEVQDVLRKRKRDVSLLSYLRLESSRWLQTAIANRADGARLCSIVMTHLHQGPDPSISLDTRIARQELGS